MDNVLLLSLKVYSNSRSIPVVALLDVRLFMNWLGITGPFSA